MIDAEVLGRNIAFHRRRRGLSQTELAELLSRSESWVSQVERGARVIDRLSVLASVAEVLEIPLSDLVGDDSPFPVRPTTHPEAVQLRRVLGTPYGLRGFVARSYGTKQKPQSIAQLRKRVAPLWDLAHEAAFSELCAELADLIPNLEVAAQLYDDDASYGEVQELLATTYQVTAALLAKLGEADAVWVAGDRAMAAAQAGGDPLEAVAGAFRLGVAFIGAQRLDEAAWLLESSIASIEPYCSDDEPASWSICGAMHAVAAVAYARLNAAVPARKHIEQARECAQHTGDGRNDFETEFGPSNVALQSVAVEVELGNAGEALRLAESVDLDALSPERRSMLRMNLAMAYQQRRQSADAARELLAAEAETPEQVRRDAKARQIVADLVRNQRGDLGELSQLAGRMELSSGITRTKSTSTH